MKNFIINTTEEEKVQQIKNWIKKNLITLIIGIVLGLGGVFGFNYYQNNQLQNNILARQNYLQIVAGDKNIKIENNAAYNNQAQLVVAKNLVAKNDYSGAIKVLLTIKTDNIIQDIANLALAKIYLHQQNNQQALAILKNNRLVTSSNHLMGDIYQSMGNIEKAKYFYNQVLQNPVSQQLKALIEIKINDLN